MPSTNESYATLFAAVQAWARANAPGLDPAWVKIQLGPGGQWVSLPISAAPVGVEESPSCYLTPCEKEIVRVITEAGRRLTGEEIKDQLAKDNSLHGCSTIDKALSSLRKTKHVITNAADSHGKGYGLPDWN